MENVLSSIFTVMVMGQVKDPFAEGRAESTVQEFGGEFVDLWKGKPWDHAPVFIGDNQLFEVLERNLC